MAEYYPLLAKAVSGLTHSTPEARRSIYERARNALLKQLRSIQPPIAEADIDREAKALDAAIARLEAELSVQSSLEEGLEAALGVSEAKPVSTAPAKLEPAKPEPAKPVAPPPAPPKPEPAKAEPPKPSAAPAKPTAPEAAKAAEEKSAPTPAKAGGLSGFAAPKTPLPKAGDEEFSPYDDAMGGETPPPLRTRQGAQRPAAPQPAENEGRQRRLGIVAGVVAAVVCLVAFAAWKLRDRPEDIAKLKPPPQQVESGGSKIVERVGGGQREPDASPRTQAPTQPPVSDSGQVLPIAHRSALLVEAPEEASKVKTYIGRVVWKLENAAGGPGQALTSAVRAEIDVAEAGLQAVMTIQKNNDSTLPASHTIRIRFTPTADGPTGAVKDIRMLETRREDMANGDPLAGINAQIAENAFLIGLMRGGAEATNVDMMRTRSWFDLPMLLANGKRAKITFEKGVSGERIVADALKQWGAQ